jgi:four helix bundle protein
MSDAIQSYRDLSVWQLGTDIAEHVYRLTREFPADERFGLISQLRRAAASVPANIAEGNARASTKEYLQHLSIAVGSLAEIETFLDLANRLSYAQR